MELQISILEASIFIMSEINDPIRTYEQKIGEISAMLYTNLIYLEIYRASTQP